MYSWKKKKWNSWPKYIKFATTILCSSRAHVPDSRLIFFFLFFFFFWIIREKVTIKYAYLAGHGLFRDTKAIYLNNCLTFSQSIKDFPQQVQQWEGKPTSKWKMPCYECSPQNQLWQQLVAWHTWRLIRFKHDCVCMCWCVEGNDLG